MRTIPLEQLVACQYLLAARRLPVSSVVRQLQAESLLELAFPYYSFESERVQAVSRRVDAWYFLAVPGLPIVQQPVGQGVGPLVSG